MKQSVAAGLPFNLRQRREPFVARLFPNLRQWMALVAVLHTSTALSYRHHQSLYSPRESNVSRMVGCPDFTLGWKQRKQMPLLLLDIGRHYFPSRGIDTRRKVA